MKKLAVNTIFNVLEDHSAISSLKGMLSGVYFYHRANKLVKLFSDCDRELNSDISIFF